MSVSDAMFGEPGFMEKLAQLDLVAKQVLSGARQGYRRTNRRGSGTLFADYRAYSPGDDPRYVDWNVYGRLGSLFVKEFEVEEAARIRIFLDRSLSMDFGRPGKLDFGRRIAAALGYIGLSRFDSVEVVSVPSGETRRFAGKATAPALFEHLVSIRPEGETRLLESVQSALAGTRRRGLSVVVSDLFDPRGFRHAVDYLLRRRHTVFIVQVVSPDDDAPDGAGFLRLVDSESGDRLKVRLDERLARRYRRVFGEFCADAERYAIGKEIGYARFRSDVPFGEAVLSLLKRKRIVR